MDTLKEDIYMEQLLGFTSSDDDHKVCKLQWSIYRLKQASRSWNTHFNDVIKMFGFIKNEEKLSSKRSVGALLSFSYCTWMISSLLKMIFPC